MSIWDDAKKNLTEWYSVTADKTSEVAKVTSRRYDKYGLSRDIERQFSELGSIVYLALQEDRADVLESPDVAALVARVADLEQELRLKDDEIEEIRRDHAGRKAAAAAAGGVPQDDPAAAADVPVTEEVDAEPSAAPPATETEDTDPEIHP